VLFLISLGCGHAQHTQAGPAAAPAQAAAPAAPQTFDEQARWGGALYGSHCAGCHGASGEGSQGAPRVVGLAEGALPLAPRPGSHRTAEFVSVADVAGFVVATMPPKAPGSLSAEEYWAILAFDLSANGLHLEQKLTPELAATLTIPR